MVEKLKDLGNVKLVQLQPNGLIIEKPPGYFYDETRRVEVDRLIINSKGIEATTSNGDHVLDIHHLDHPDKEYDDDDLVCIGFTSHYDKMREHFGEHMVYGSAGENIIIEYPEEIWLDARSQDEKLPAGELKDILQFLNNGRRGFLLVLGKGQKEGTVRPGDKVFVLGPG